MVLFIYKDILLFVRARLAMIVLDIETTGFENNVDEILQLSIVNEKREVLFNKYFKPSRVKRWDNAMAVNGITPDMVKDCGSFADSLNEIQSIFDKHKELCGYNTMFDLDFLKAYGVVLREDVKIIDVMIEFAEFYNDWDDYHCNFVWKSLVFASAYFGYDWEINAHNSLGDVLATLFLYEQLRNVGKVEYYVAVVRGIGNKTKVENFIEQYSKREGVIKCVKEKGEVHVYIKNFNRAFYICLNMSVDLWVELYVKRENAEKREIYKYVHKRLTDWNYRGNL